MVEASVRQYWTMDDGTMTPEVSNLVEMFMAMTSMCISLCIVRVLAFAMRRNPPAGPVRGAKDYS